MDDIKTWLNSTRNYDEGVQLYNKYGTDAAIIRSLSESPSPFKRKLLADSLQAIWNGRNKKEPADKKPLTHDSKLSTLNSQLKIQHNRWPKELDEYLTVLYNKWRPLFAEMNHLQATIYEVALAGERDPLKKKEAGQMAHRILDLDDECDAIYKKRDHYLATNKPLEDAPPVAVVVDAKKLPKALANAERYVREYKNQLRKNPADERAAKNLKKWEEMVQYYKKEMGLCEEPVN